MAIVTTEAAGREDGRTMFVSVRHPGESDKSTFDNPVTRGPDFKPGVPPRPAVLVIARDVCDEIGN